MANEDKKDFNAMLHDSKDMARRSASGPAADDGRHLFLLDRGGERGLRLLPRACPFCQSGAVPAVPDRAFALLVWVRRQTAGYSCHAVAQKQKAAVCCGYLFLPCRGGKRERLLSPAAFPLYQTDAVPAIPDWASALQPQVRQAAKAYSCGAGVPMQEVGGYCGYLFLPDQAFALPMWVRR